MNFFMEVAKLRAARLLWAQLVKDQFGATEPQVALAAHPLPDLGLVAHRAGRLQQRRRAPASRRWPPPRGTPSACTPTPSTRRSRCPPTSRPGSPATPSWCCSRSRAPRRVIDPWGGSRPTSSGSPHDLAERAWQHIEEVEAAGGMAKAIEAGIPKMRIEEAAARTQARIDSGQQPVIGVNRYPVDEDEPIEVLRVDNARGARPAAREARAAARRARRRRHPGRAGAAHGRRAAPVPTARSTRNLLALAIDAARAMATVGEMSAAMEEVFGRYTAQIRTIGGVYSAEAGEDATVERGPGARRASSSATQGRRPRILVAKMGQDGHDRGQKVIATAFADLGFDVDVGPLFQTPGRGRPPGRRGRRARRRRRARSPPGTSPWCRRCAPSSTRSAARTS